MKQSILRQTFTLFNLVNLILAVLVWSTGSYKNLLFMNLVVINWAVGIFQTVRSQKILDRLALLHQNEYERITPTGTEKIGASAIQLDDVLILVQGDQAPCDGTVLSGLAELNESLLTGESDEILKREGDTITAGTSLLSGTLKIKVTVPPAETEIQHVQNEAAKLKEHPSQLRDGIQSIIKLSTIILIPAGILLFLRSYYHFQDGLDASILSTSAAIIGMIPEGLVMLTTVALTLSSIRLARENVLIHDLYCAENLARTDMLCLDKTGTLTTGKMTLVAIIPEDLESVVAKFYGTVPDSNATANAIRQGLEPGQFSDVTSVVPFNSTTKCSSLTENGTTWTIGAPGDPTAAQYAAQGYRVLAIKKDGQLCGHILLQDPVKPDARQTLTYFKNQGVQLKIISGDDPATVQAIANQCGIQGNAVDMRSVTDIKRAVINHSIFGRTTPAQKKAMVETLKEAGYTVSMTGDGINDVPALKAADCSIAMGSGTQAARTISNLILLDDQFAQLPDVLLSGRQVINNITRTASLFLVKTFFSLGLTLLTLFWLKQYPFHPIQLTLVSSLTVGIPAFILTLEPNNKKVEGSFLSTVLHKAIPGAATLILMIIALDIIRRFVPFTDPQYSTMATILAGINGLCVLAFICQPLTGLRRILLLSCTLAFSASILFLHNFYSLVPLNGEQTTILAILASLVPLAIHTIKEKLASVEFKQKGM